MDAFAHMIGEKMGDMVEDAVKNALGVGDKDKDKDEDESKGGILSLFGGNKKKKKEEEEEEEEEKDKGGFFTKLFNKDDDDGREKKSGFKGLFNEQEGAFAAGGDEEGMPGGNRGTVAVNDGDLFNDLMDVAEETSNEN